MTARRVLARALCLATWFAALGATGCRSAAVSTVEPPAPTTRHGLVGFEYVAVGAPTLPTLAAGEEYEAAYAQPDNPLPVYPAKLLRLALPRQEVVVRVIIDGEGTVIGVEDSPASTALDARYQPDFFAAVRDAVARWRFNPAQIRSFGPGPDDDGDGKADYSVMTKRAAITSYHDLRFVFEVKEGKGLVKGG